MTEPARITASPVDSESAPVSGNPSLGDPTVPSHATRLKRNSSHNGHSGKGWYFDTNRNTYGFLGQLAAIHHRMVVERKPDAARREARGGSNVSGVT